MPRVVVTGEVDDAAEWETKFRTHGDLFRSQTATAIHFTVTNQNEFAILAEVDDLGTWREILESSATEQAMAHDGVKRKTVKVYELDKEYDL